MTRRYVIKGLGSSPLLEDSKEAVYGALDAWVAWEQTFPLASLRRALILLEKEQQWHKVVQLGDFGLAKWKTNGDSVQTRVLGTFAYLAPEYAEDGIVSVKMDVYAFGVVLLQLILGHGVFGSRERNQPSLLQWVVRLLELENEHVQDLVQ